MSAPPTHTPWQQVSQPNHNHSPLVSILIPAKNAAPSINWAIQSAEEQKYCNIEIVVVDDHSTDGTLETASRISSTRRVIFAHNKGRGTASALNTALEYASGEYVARLDAHCHIHPDYIKTAVDMMGDNIDAVGGVKVPQSSSRIGQAFGDLFNSRWSCGNSKYHYSTSESLSEHLAYGVYKRAVLLNHDGWDDGFRVNQDAELDYRIRKSGGKLLFTPSLKTTWKCQETLQGIARQFFRYGRGRAKTCIIHPRSTRARHALPPAVAALAALSLLRRGRTATVLAALYLVSIIIGSRTTSNGRISAPEVLIKTAILAIIHTSWTAGFTLGILIEAPKRVKQIIRCSKSKGL